MDLPLRTDVDGVGVVNSVCWSCGGTGDYLEGDESRAIECFGCQVSREVAEADSQTQPKRTYLRLDEVVAEFEHTRPRHSGSVMLAAPILGYRNPKSLSKALYRARSKGIDVKFIDDHERAR